MNAGELRHRVTLQRPNMSRNDAGQFVPEPWTNVSDLWANIEPQGGREYENDLAITAETSHLVTVRWNKNITVEPKMRFLHRHNGTDRYLEIESTINRGERDREVICACKETLA